AAARIGAVEQILVRPLKVEEIGQGVANLRILEQGLARVEGKALHALRGLIGDLLFLEKAGGERRAVVADGPILRDILDADIELPGLERVERDRWVAVLIVPDRIEIEAPARDRQILTPIVGVAL